MRPLIEDIRTSHAPETLAARLNRLPGVVLLRSALPGLDSARYSFLAANPFLVFRSSGSRCQIRVSNQPASDWQTSEGDPWKALDILIARYEQADESALPFPLGGCIGCWGYDLKDFIEPKLARRASTNPQLPQCHAGFYDSLVAFDHALGKAFVISTGLTADGSRDERKAEEQRRLWRSRLLAESPAPELSDSEIRDSPRLPIQRTVSSNLSKAQFIAAVERAQRYIRSGDIYQVNLSHCLSTHCGFSGWRLFKRLLKSSPAPFAAYLDCGDFQVASASPEQFLRMSGTEIQTRPIKGTRPRDPDPARDARLGRELQTSPKELAELVMITDLMRNDLGKACEFGSVQTLELARLERFAQVQHLVSTVQGRLRKEISHVSALESCFPGGSVTGAPKFRAMQIIDELEPISRGFYTGCHGYLGFNRQSQLAMTIRTAICRDGAAHFNVGAGIVADSNPESEFEETMAKAAGFALSLGS